MTAYRYSPMGRKEAFSFMGWPLVSGLCFFEQLISSYRRGSSWIEHQRDGELLPQTTKQETDRYFKWRIALPGIAAEQLSLSVEHHSLVLEIRGIRKTGRPKTHAIKRAFCLPVYTDGQAIAARLKNGILTITLPKTDKPVAATSGPIPIH